MMDANKKISFGFNKLAKKSAVIRTQPVQERKVELVECLEGQSIKIKDAVEIVDEPLVIPIKDDKKNLLDRVKEAKAKQRVTIQEDNRPDSELTIEELAARALINDAKNRLEKNIIPSGKISVLPLKEDKFVNEGEEEPTLEDYENIPISDYGMAMLRGMGWKNGMGIGKNTTQAAAVSAPELRPKGLGLGATRIVKTEEPACDKDGNALILKRGTYAKIIAGLHKGNYCEVQGLDDEAGRVIVKTSLKGDILTLNEFLLVPVTKEEFTRGAKVLNNAKYEEYKEISDRKLEAYKEIKTEVKDNYSEIKSEKDVIFKNKSNSKQKDISSYKKRDDSYSSDENNSNSDDDKRRRSRENSTYKNKSKKDDRNKYRNERYRSRSKDKRTSSPSDSDDKYEKSRNKYRDSSESDAGSSRKKKSKDKKNKKDRHRDRSMSRKESQNSYKSSKSRSKGRSPSNDYKEGSSKRHKSKSRHRGRSRSNSSDENSRRSRR